MRDEHVMILFFEHATWKRRDNVALHFFNGSHAVKNTVMCSRKTQRQVVFDSFQWHF
jgi:hypothetical protein